MEAAAKTVELLTQRHLPEKPHTLSTSPDWRHTKPTTDSRPFEEWNSQRLQYTTFLSEADRGVLLTRPYYDMREEPPKPVPREVNALSNKNGSEKKKLSLSDYKNKKTTGAAPSPEPSAHRGRDSSSTTPSHNTPSGNSIPRSKSDTKPHHESRPMEHSRSRESDSSGDGRRLQHNHRADTSLPPKPLPKNSSLPPRPPSPLNKRRVSGYDDEPRPPKRNRPDDDRGYDDGGRHRDDHYNRRDNGRRDASLPNGKGLPRSSSHRGASPNSRPRGDSANVVRPHASGSSRGTPTKQLTPSKGSVPPLLSPLRLSFEEEERNAKKRREESPERSPRPRKSEPTHNVKKPRLKLPPLLSPTLPPAVEAALQRKRKEADDYDDLDSQKFKLEPSDDDLPPPPKKERKRFMVTLRVKKAYRADFRRLLALSSQARKRPTSNADSGTEGVAMKKSRSSDMHSSSRSLGPTTPPRKSTTAMSRVNSNNSTAQTPGDSAPPPSSAPSDRRTNGQEMPKSAAALKERESRMSQLGRRLKHDADVAFRGQPTPNSTNSSRSMEPNSKLGYVLGLESILAFMLGFQAQNQYRTACNKTCDPTGWKSLFPYMDYLNREIRRNDHNRPKYLPLSALLQLFNAMAVEESLKCCLTLEGTAGVSLAEVLKLERMRGRIWPQVREETAGIDDTRYKTEVHPWTTLDEVAAAAVRVLRRWSADEDLDWSPDIHSRDYGR